MTDWTDDDVLAYVAFCDSLGIADRTVPLHVWASESNNDPSAHNPDGNASGLFQLMPATAKSLGYDTDADPTLAAYRALSVAEQLTWATKYYATERPYLGTVGEFYTCTFLPAVAHLAYNPAFVLCALGGPYEWAYKDNLAFDRAKKGSIVVQDLVDAADREYGPREPRGIAARVAAVGS